jgi:Lambda phage tail tube protein, TTP
MAQVAPGRPTEALLGYTTTLERGEGSGENIVWTDVGEVTDLTVWDGSRDAVEVTNHRSPGGSLEFIPGLIDWGSASFELNFVPSAQITRDLLEDFKSAGNSPWRAIFPEGEVWQFNASLTSYTVTAPVKDVMKGSFDLKISGSPELITDASGSVADVEVSAAPDPTRADTVIAEPAA